jgi:hypothetical protein
VAGGFFLPPPPSPPPRAEGENVRGGGVGCDACGLVYGIVPTKTDEPRTWRTTSSGRLPFRPLRTSIAAALVGIRTVWLTVLSQPRPTSRGPGGKPRLAASPFSPSASGGGEHAVADPWDPGLAARFLEREANQDLTPGFSPFAPRRQRCRLCVRFLRAGSSTGKKTGATP